MSEDILEQVIADIKTSLVTISLQLDESTDVSNCSQLIAVVRYVKKKKIEESFLFCQSLETTTKPKDVFGMIKEFFMKHQLHLDKIGSICTEGAPAMLGNRSGFVALLRKEILSLKINHCFVHRHALAAKTSPLKLKKALEICVKVVNTIRGRALNHRLFQLFCKELGVLLCKNCFVRSFVSSFNCFVERANSAFILHRSKVAVTWSCAISYV